MTARAVRVVVVGASLAAALAVVSTGLGPVQAAGRQGQEPTPTFRSSVDLVVVDAQVVNDEGVPVADLTPADFEVTISGKRRRVVSADYIRSATVDGRPIERSRNVGVTATNIWPTIGEPPTGRTYILAFDVGSLTVGDSRGVVESAEAFVTHLLPGDRVGLYVFPVGQWIEPTTDRIGLRRELDRVVGSASARMDSRFNLSISEVIDINAEPIGRTTGVMAAVAARECPEIGLGCVDQIRLDAQAQAFYLEGRAVDSLNGMRALIGSLGEYPGRKTVVLFSSGMPTSDRPGGRPDVGDLPRTLGQEAARTNTSIYTMFVDSAGSLAMAAETRRAVGSPATRNRDMAAGSRVLEEFTAASGGALSRILTGSGEFQLDRVLSETSSYYLLGVEPESADRNGKARPLRVKVDRKGTTIRSRLWVIVPKPTLEG